MDITGKETSEAVRSLCGDTAIRDDDPCRDNRSTESHVRSYEESGDWKCNEPRFPAIGTSTPFMDLDVESLLESFYFFVVNDRTVPYEKYGEQIHFHLTVVDRTYRLEVKNSATSKKGFVAYENVPTTGSFVFYIYCFDTSSILPQPPNLCCIAARFCCCSSCASLAF